MLRTFKDDKEFYASLPKKRVGAGALLFYKDTLLIVQPTYNPGWLLPGGTVEGEESPYEGLLREVREELHLIIEPQELLCVDYISNRDVKGEYIQFLFSAKDLTEEQAQKIQLQEYELKDYNFKKIEDALTMLAPPVSRRVHSVLKYREENSGALYLENGLPLNLKKIREYELLSECEPRSHSPD